MKPNFTLSLVFLLFASATFAQTIRRVNATPGAATGVNVYATIQAAHDAANGGDFIYVEPSSPNAGSLTATKQLFIYGGGYSYGQPNGGPVVDIIFGAGSGGSELVGLACQGVIYVRVGSIKINRTQCKNIYIDPTSTPAGDISNVSILQSQITSGPLIFGAGSIYIVGRGVGGKVSNITIKNNIINESGLPIFVPNNDATNIEISNNVFQVFVGSIEINLRNCVFSNNIFQSGAVSQTSVVGSTLSNNVTPNAISGVNSLVLSFAALRDNHFVDSFNGDFTLKVGSVLKTAGIGGGEVGIFGGSSPYVVSGTPPIPQITKLTTTAIGNSTTPLSVTVSTKSNN